MFHSIAKAFKALDNFLTACEEYVAQRVWNGKFIYDLKFLSESSIDNTKRTFHRLSETIHGSNAYNSTVAFVKKFVGLLMQFQIVEDVVMLIGDGIRLCVKYFAHYLFVLIVGLASTFLLLMTFKYAPLAFLLLFLPVLYVNHLFLSSFFALVAKKEEGTHFTLAEALVEAKITLPVNTFFFLLQISFLVTKAIFLIGFAFVLSYIFKTISIEWSSSFLYWLPVVMLGLLLVIILYVAEVVLSFSYAFALLDKKNSTQTLSRSFYHMQTDFRHSLLFYLLLTFFSIFFIGFAGTNNYEGGFAVSILLTSHAFLLLGFLLRKKYFKNYIEVTTSPLEKMYKLLKPMIGFGFISYILTASLMLQVYPDIILFLDEQRPTIAAKYEYSQHTNTEAGYVIDSPRPWTIYRWNTNSATIYTNVTGTETGGIKVNITVLPLEGSNYFTLYEANSGLINYDTATKNVTTKIANVTINGNNAVKYTYTKTGARQTEYETHYIIRNNEKVYDIAFVTVSKKIEAVYMDIFDRMVESFKLLPQK